MILVTLVKPIGILIYVIQIFGWNLLILNLLVDSSNLLYKLLFSKQMLKSMLLK